MAGDRPDWRKGTVAHRCAGGACPVSDVQDWNKVVMAYPPGDPQLTKDYEDWVHGTVYEEGSSACLYDCEKLLIHEIGEKTADFSDEVTINLTAAQAAYSGILVQLALSKRAEPFDRILSFEELVDSISMFPSGAAAAMSTEEEATVWIEAFVLSATPLYLKVSDPVSPDPYPGKTYTREITIPYSKLNILEGETVFHLDGYFTTSGTPPAIMHFLKFFLIYGSGTWGLGRFRAKGDGGITW